MDCRRCGTELDRPGDYCLACNTANCDAVVAAFERERATLTFLRDLPEHAKDEAAPEIVGETTITTVPEKDPEAEVVELRNFAGKVADEIRRKRPEEVYAAG
ncbi:MAG: metal-binding protein, partial [Halolamina sp.]